MLAILKSIRNDPGSWLLGVLEFRNSRKGVYEKLEKNLVRPFRDRPRTLLARHFSAQSQMFRVLCHVIVLNVEHRMLLL